MLSDPPDRDTIEVSIFGPGKGESIAVHLGYGRWIVVDSCIDQADRTIPALDYLRRIGVDLAKDVLMVVGTHAHDDHIAGISSVFEACESALFVCSSAGTLEEFHALVEDDRRGHEVLRVSSYSEYRAIFDLIKSRGRTSGRAQLRWAIENRALLELEGDGSARVLALSPSDEAVVRAKRSLSRELDALREDRRRVATADPNEFSVVLWVEAADKRILLGADLLNGPARCGWRAILDFFDPLPAASVFKVPHHGAPNAHHDDVWEKLLDPDLVALMAPYRAGARPRPDASDRQRILALTSQAYITASPDYLPRSRSIKKSASMLSGIAKNVRDPWGKSGHVRARSRIGVYEWSINYVNPARPLSV